MNELACRVIVAGAGRGSHLLIGVYASVRCRRTQGIPAALDAAIQRAWSQSAISI